MTGHDRNVPPSSRAAWTSDIEAGNAKPLSAEHVHPGQVVDLDGRPLQRQLVPVRLTASVVVRFDSPADALACHANWTDVSVPEPAVLSEPADGPADGAVEFHLIDLHGNLVRFGGFPA